jgi:hypothetical protein
MSKYYPLGEFLRGQSTAEVPMTFAAIERVTGAKLPPKAQNYAAWWSNNPSNNVMTKIWLAAGFKTERVDIAGRRLVFRRVRDAADHTRTQPRSAAPADGTVEAPPAAGRHPMFGALKGLLTVTPGADVTKPADPAWGEP